MIGFGDNDLAWEAVDTSFRKVLLGWVSSGLELLLVIG